MKLKLPSVDALQFPVILLYTESPASILVRAPTKVKRMDQNAKTGHMALLHRMNHIGRHRCGDRELVVMKL